MWPYICTLVSHIQGIEQVIHTRLATEGMSIGVCVMEEQMSSSLHCNVPANEWRSNGSVVCPPPSCNLKYNPRTQYECIPYINRETCYSPYMHETAVCLVNNSDLSYAMCKSITPFQMYIIAEWPNFKELVRQCFLHLHPDSRVSGQKLSDFALVPLDSLHFTPLNEDSCLDMYQYYKQKNNMNPENFTMGVINRRPPNTMIYIEIIFMCIGAASLTLTLCLVIPMMLGNHEITAIEVYLIVLSIIFTLIFLISGVDLVTRYFTDMFFVFGCYEYFFVIFQLWLGDLVYFLLVAMCYDRTYAIARPFKARRTLSPKRSKIICGTITAVTFLLNASKAVGFHVENYMYGVTGTLQHCHNPGPSKRTPYIFTTLVVPILTSIIYVLGWLFLLVLNIVLVYHLVFNARKWRREVPIHQVASVMGISLADLIISIVHVINYGVWPIMELVAFRVHATRSLGVWELEMNEVVGKYFNFFNMVSPIQFLMTGFFVLTFTPKYKEKIASMCCCKEKEKQEDTNKRNPTLGKEDPNNVDQMPRQELQQMPHLNERDLADAQMRFANNSNNPAVASIEMLITAE